MTKAEILEGLRKEYWRVMWECMQPVFFLREKIQQLEAEVKAEKKQP